MATVGTSAVVEPLDAKKRWVFKTTQNDDLIAAALIKHMKKNGVKTIGFIGFNDPYGENWYKVFGALAEKAGIRIVASERYARTDQSVTGQSLKLIAAKPDAVLIAGGRRAGGAAAGHAVRPGLQGPRVPDARGGHRRLHQARQGKGRRHRARRRADARHRRDPGLESDQEGRAGVHRRVREAVRQRSRRRSAPTPGTAASCSQRAIPVALKAGKPGTEAFRVALRDALEHEREVVGTQGVFNMSATNHNGMDERARVLVVVRTASSGCCPSERVRPRPGQGRHPRTHRRHPARGRSRRALRRRQAAGAVAVRRRTASRRHACGRRIGAAPARGAQRRRRRRAARRFAARTTPWWRRAREWSSARARTKAWARASRAALPPRADADGWIVALADMPWIAPATIARGDARRATARRSWRRCYRGERGHPVGFARAYRAALVALSGDEGRARRSLRGNVRDAREDRRRRSRRRARRRSPGRPGSCT